MVREAGLEPTVKVQRHIRLVRGYILRYRQHVIFVMKQQLQLEPAEKYVDIEEIAPCMLRELIKMIYAEAPDRSSGERSERIRTYNYPQGRVTDHRIGLTLHKLDSIVNGDLDELLSALITAKQSEQLRQVK